MISPTVAGGDTDTMCFSFWWVKYQISNITLVLYIPLCISTLIKLMPNFFMNRFAAFGAGETTSLRIYRRDANINDRHVDEQADPHDDEGNSATVKPIFI